MNFPYGMLIINICMPHLYENCYMIQLLINDFMKDLRKIGVN
jgi:hypothetical protein